MKQKRLIRQNPKARIFCLTHQKCKIQNTCCHRADGKKLFHFFILHTVYQCRYKEDMGNREVIADSGNHRKERTAHIHYHCSQITVKIKPVSSAVLHHLLIQKKGEQKYA